MSNETGGSSSAAASTPQSGAGGSLSGSIAGDSGGGGTTGSAGTVTTDAASSGTTGEIDGGAPRTDAGARAAQDADGAGGHKVPYRALAITSGTFHSCALLDDHNVKCWGTNLYGQLGYGDQENRWLLTGMGDDLPFVDLGTGRTVTSVVAGHYATCAILDNGSVKCWGFGPQLGLGETPPWGDEPGEMGDNLPAVDLGAGRTAKQIGVGYWKACALLDDDSVKCWDQSPLPAVTVLGAPIAEISSGYAPYARFADGTVGEPESTERVALGRASPATALFSTDIGLCALLGDNSTVCQFKNEMAAVPPWGGPGIVAVSLSSFPGKHQCGLMLGGSVRCWVPPFYPETWVDPDVPADAQGGVTVKLAGPAVSVTSGGADYACALLNDGRVQCWGDQAAFLGNVDVNNGAHTIPLDLGTHWVP